MSIIYWSAPDGSWGACQTDALVIVPAEDISPSRMDAINAAADIGDDECVRVLLMRANQSHEEDNA